MAGKNQAYAERYAEFAMEQMRLYGIPASVTLAQGILESASGQSRLAQNENNHFGIKATQSWIANGGKYGLYSDDKPNEKFCSYDSVGDSYAHHSGTHPVSNLMRTITKDGHRGLIKPDMLQPGNMRPRLYPLSSVTTFSDMTVW